MCMNLVDKVSCFFGKKYNSSKKKLNINKNKNKKKLVDLTSEITLSINKINHFSQVKFCTQLIHFSHYLIRTRKHELKHSYCMYNIFLICLFCASKNYQSFVPCKIELCNLFKCLYLLM